MTEVTARQGMDHWLPTRPLWAPTRLGEAGSPLLVLRGSSLGVGVGSHHPWVVVLPDSLTRPQGEGGGVPVTGMPGTPSTLSPDTMKGGAYYCLAGIISNLAFSDTTSLQPAEGGSLGSSLKPCWGFSWTRVVFFCFLSY